MALLTDGYSTRIQLQFGGLVSTGGNGTGADLALNLLVEREVHPPGLDGGGKIDVTHMRNIRWRTAVPKSLVTVEELTVMCLYDPVAYQVLVTTLGGFIQVEEIITIFFPDGSEISLPGWVESFKPQNHKEGDLPLAEVKLMFGMLAQPLILLESTAPILVTASGFR